MKKEIVVARKRQERRYSKDPVFHCNGNLEARAQLDKFGPAMDQAVMAHFRRTVRALDISPRLRDKMLFVSQTLADLEEAARIRQKDIDEAVTLMGLNHPYFQDMR